MCMEDMGLYDEELSLLSLVSWLWGGWWLFAKEK